MKNKLLIFLILISLVIIFTLMAAAFQAKARADLQIKIVKPAEIINYCPSGSLAMACFNYQTQTITIRSDLNPLTARSVITHEYGHYLMQDITEEEYKAVFKDHTGYKNFDEMAAVNFTFWLWHPNAPFLTDEMRAFYLKVIK